MSKRLLFFLILIVPSFSLLACGGGGDSAVSYSPSAVQSGPSEWMWVSGSDTAGQAGSYGTKGVAAANNIPGGRENATSRADTSGNVWLFGGWGYDSVGSGWYLNDLWKYDGSNWTWVSGSYKADQPGSYGIKGVTDAGNAPRARSGAVSWVDNSGNFWLFGGYQTILAGGSGHLNDLWKFDGSNWTWVSGSDAWDQAGSYGILGVAATGNVPGARDEAVSWVDKSGNLWLFGGWGYDSAGAGDYLNDLWKFDGSNWTWISGSAMADQAGSYGIKGVTAAGNVPGARAGAVSWVDNSGNLRLFGGYGYDSTGFDDCLNDLWRY